MTNHTFFFNKINDIPKNIWEELACSSNVYFTLEYLSAIEKNNSHLQFFYVILKNDQHKAIAFASVQMINFYLNSIESEFSNPLKKLSSILRKLKIFPKEKPLKVLNCGNTFVSGEHGIFVKEGQNKFVILKKIAKEIYQYTQKNSQLDSIDIFIMKDFVANSLPISNQLINFGYYSFNAEPNMKLKIDQRWLSFEDYLGALKTKFRIKAKKALQLSSDLLVKDINAENFDDQVSQMIELYKRVVSKASFNLDEFNLATFKDLKQNLGDSYILKSYWIENKMVGFMSGVIYNKNFDAHFVGIDYKLNKQKAIYQRMLYDYIEIAIVKKVSILNFGRTASEIKSSVGAIPEHLTLYIRHQKTITNKILKLFLLKIHPKEYHQKFPFKNDIKKL